MGHEQSRDDPGEALSLARLALPLIAVNVGQQLMGVVDTALSGRIDALAQAATGLGNTIFFFGALFGIGLTMGIDPLTAQAFGAGRADAARRAMWQCVWASLLIGPPIALFTVAAGHALETLGIAPDLAAETRRYLDARLLSLLPLFVVTAVRSYLQSAHRTAPIVVAAVVANLFNLVADWVLIFGDEGLVHVGLPAVGVPALGVAGIGWATTAATALNLAVLVIAIGRRRDESAIAVDRRPNAKLLRRLFALGTPIGLHMLAEVGIFSIAGLLAGTMGAVAMAAHQVALQLAALTFMIPLGIGAATSVRVGHAIGRGDLARVRRAGFAGIVMGAGFMTVSAVSMWLLPGAYARLMASDPNVVALASRLIVIAGAFQIFDGTQAVSAGALRGAGMTRWTMVANFFAYWIVGFPVLVALGFGFDFGPYGLWWGLTIGLAVAALLLATKFASVSRRPIAAIELG